MAYDNPRSVDLLAALELWWEDKKDLDILTGCPAVVESYTPDGPDGKRADIRIPFIQGKQVDDGTRREEKWPILPGIMVKFFRAGPWLIHAPLKKGDLVWVTWSLYPVQEYSVSDGKTDIIAQWQGRHLPGSAFCEPWAPFPEKNNPGKPEGNSLVVEHQDGKVRLVLSESGELQVVADKVRLGSLNAGTELAKGSTVDSNETTIQTKLDLALGIFGIPPIGLLPSTKSGKVFSSD